MPVREGPCRHGAVPVIVTLAATGFFLHFAWEMWQVPFFRKMAAVPHQQVVWLCTGAALGDVAIGTGALLAPRLLGQGPLALVRLRPVAIAAWVLTGLLATIVLEIHATRLAHRWQYAEAMPVVPVLGVGVLPLLQWLLVPAAMLFFTRYFCLGWWSRRAGGKQSSNDSGVS